MMEEDNLHGAYCSSGEESNRFGNMYFDKGQFRKARICYQISLDKGFDQAVMNLAYCLFYKEDKKAKATKMVQRVSWSYIHNALDKLIQQKQIQQICLEYVSI